MLFCLIATKVGGLICREGKVSANQQVIVPFSLYLARYLMCVSILTSTGFLVQLYHLSVSLRESNLHHSRQKYCTIMLDGEENK